MPTNKKTIDTYNASAKDWAKAKRDGSAIFHIYLEKPAIYDALPDLHEKTVLCIGSGSGEEVEHLYSLGAKKVIGIDISEELTKIAKETYPEYEFQVMDMEKMDFPQDSFDLAFSSLTLHYIDDWKSVLQSLHKSLKNDGLFIFSTVHPFFSAVEKHEDEKVKSRLLGYLRDKVTKTLKIYGNYFDNKENDVIVNKVFTVTNWHRPLSSVIKDIVHSNFELLDIVEPKALDEAKAIDLDFWEVHQKIPEFIVYKLRKK